MLQLPTSVWTDPWSSTHRFISVAHLVYDPLTKRPSTVPLFTQSILGGLYTLAICVAGHTLGPKSAPNRRKMTPAYTAAAPGSLAACGKNLSFSRSGIMQNREHGRKSQLTCVGHLSLYKQAKLYPHKVLCRCPSVSTSLHWTAASIANSGAIGRGKEKGGWRTTCLIIKFQEVLECLAPKLKLQNCRIVFIFFLLKDLLMLPSITPVLSGKKGPFQKYLRFLCKALFGINRKCPESHLKGRLIDFALAIAQSLPMFCRYPCCVLNEQSCEIVCTSSTVAARRKNASSANTNKTDDLYPYNTFSTCALSSYWYCLQLHEKYLRFFLNCYSESFSHTTRCQIHDSVFVIYLSVANFGMYVLLSSCVWLRWTVLISSSPSRSSQELFVYIRSIAGVQPTPLPPFLP